MAKRVKKEVKPKFKWGDFKLFTGVGIVCAGLGVLLFWAAYTVPEGVKGSSSVAISTTQRLVRMIPQDIQNRIAMVISVLFILFGTFLVLSAFYSAIKFIITKKN